MSGTHPPPAYSRYPPPSAPVGNPPSATHGQYPQSGVSGQYPPHGGYPTPWSGASYPQHTHNRYPGPGQHPPPSAPPEYQPSTTPGVYPPHATAAMYPQAGAQAQYPMPYGQYPPPSRYPGISGQYPPPGTYPPSGAPVQYPQPGGYPPAPAADPYLSIGATGVGSVGEDTVDSDGVDYICARHSTNPVHVEFQNRTGMKIVLMEGDKRGKFRKVEKLRDGESVEFDSYETHPFWATTTKETCKGYPVINGNLCYFLEKTCGGPTKIVDITVSPHVNHLRSAPSGPPVAVKFSNRTRESVLIKAIDANGHTHVIKNLSARKAWLYTSFEGQYFIACQTGREEKKLNMNLGEFYLAQQGNNHRVTKKVIVTEPEDSDSSDSSDSSCSDSSSSESDY